MNNSGIALIMVLLNEAESLPRLIESVARQTLQPDEIIICDTGSEDDTMKILGSWQKSLPQKVNIIERAGANIARGRNQAINASVSPIICVTDGGCVLDQNWIEQISLPLRSGDEATGIVYGKTVAVGKGRIGRQFSFMYDIKTEDDLQKSDYSANSMAFRKSTWDAVGGFPEWLTLAAEDILFARQIEKISRSQIASKARVFWYHGEESLGEIFKKHLRNSKGEGEANLFGARYLALTSIYISMLVMLISSLFRLVLLPSSILIAIAMCCRHTAMAIKKGANLIDALAILPTVTLVRDIGMIAGFLIGLKLRISNRNIRRTLRAD